MRLTSKGGRVVSARVAMVAVCAALPAYLLCHGGIDFSISPAARKRQVFAVTVFLA